jgi:hypothetical protein
LLSNSTTMHDTAAATCRCIYIRRSLVQKQQRRSSHERAGNTQQLLLPCRVRLRCARSFSEDKAGSNAIQYKQMARVKQR